MKIKVLDREPLLLKVSSELREEGPFTASTPYVTKLIGRMKRPSYRNSKLPLKLMCLEALRLRMEKLGGYQSFCEPFAGVGLSARLFGVEAAHAQLNDFDASCGEALRLNFPKANVTVADANSLELAPADVVFLDYNAFTLKRYEKKHAGSVARAFASAQKFVIVNDCSVFYFRYGDKAYETYSKFLGSPITDYASYFKAAVPFWKSRYPEWSLVQVSAFRDSSFLLFSKKKSAFKYEYMETPKPIVELIEG